MLALRRMTAFILDYGVILTWAGALFSIAFYTGRADPLPTEPDTTIRLIGQVRGFLTMTLPTWAYFTVMECFGWKATLGKRLMGVRVEGQIGAIMQRNIFKFLPWEIAHTGLWFGMAQPLSSPPNMVGIILLTGSMAMVTMYFFGLFTPSGLTLYDRLSGTRITKHIR